MLKDFIKDIVIHRWVEFRDITFQAILVSSDILHCLLTADMNPFPGPARVIIVNHNCVPYRLDHVHHSVLHDSIRGEREDKYLSLLRLVDHFSPVWRVAESLL